MFPPGALAQHHPDSVALHVIRYMLFVPWLYGQIYPRAEAVMVAAEFVGPSGRISDGGGKVRRFATSRAIFRGYDPAIPLTVANLAIFVTTGREQEGESG
jgi:hypothetical protein